MEISKMITINDYCRKKLNSLDFESDLYSNEIFGGADLHSE